MNSQTIKLELINWVAQLKDKNLLQSLSSIKDSAISGDWYDHLSDKQKKSIQKGIEDHKKGRVLNSKQFWARYGRET